jgi:glycosyltransferase involved in cell wall biosynthesis
MADLVSIVIPVYNGPAFIGESIKSCLRQTHKKLEVIVVNDGSQDESRDMVLECCARDSRVRLLDLPHGGKVAAINAGVAAAQGQFLAIHAADDVCLPYRIERQVEALRQSKAVLSFGDMEVVDHELRTIHPSFWRANRLRLPSGNVLERLLVGNFVSGGTILFRRAIRDDIFPMPNDLPFEDWWIAVAASMQGELACVRSPLIKYRQHAGNDNGTLRRGDARAAMERQLRLIRRTHAYYPHLERLIAQADASQRRKRQWRKHLDTGRLLNFLPATNAWFRRWHLLMRYANWRTFWPPNRTALKILLYCAVGHRLLLWKFRH